MVGLRLSCVWLQLSLVLLVVVAGDSHEEEEGSEEEEEEEEEQHQLFGSYSHYGSRRLRQNSNPGGGCVVDIGMMRSSSVVDYGGSCDHGDVSSACIGQTGCCCCCCPQPWAITTHADDYVALLLLLILVVHQSMTSSSSLQL